MLMFTKDMIIAPIVRRAGTMVAGYLTGLGVGPDHVAQIVAGLVALSLVSVDLVMSASAKSSRKGA